MNFEETLAVLFGKEMQTNPQLCRDIWSALANVEWFNEDGSKFSCSWRLAGGIISDILGEGDYLDWYMSGPDGMVTDKIGQVLAEAGWHFKLV